MMKNISLDMFQTAALAMIFLAMGRFLTRRVGFLRKCCFPATVVGSLLFAIVHLVLYEANVVQFNFDETIKNFFMVIFFTSIGFSASFSVLKKGGAKAAVFLVVTIAMVVLQNVLGCAMASFFGWDARLGLCTGSISLVGGHGTAAAYGDIFEKAGLVGANVLAVASATFGLVAGSMMGAPLSYSLIKKNGLKSAAADAVGEEKIDAQMPAKNWTAAMVLLLTAAGIGTLLTQAMNGVAIFTAKLTFPAYIGGMLVAAIFRNLCDLSSNNLPHFELGVWNNAALSLFLSIALMSLKLWQLADLALPMMAMLFAQTVLLFLFARFVVFRIMGSDYEAAVMTAGFCGFGLGATPNAMANMHAIAEKHGPAPQAFLVVPLVGSLFIDFFNSLAISFFANVFGK